MVGKPIVQVIFNIGIAYALVICNHGPPHPRGIAGTLTFRFSIPCYNPHTAGTVSW